ncbi:MAG TPA: SPOR domain-containing protein [Chloroflexota bacterium]|nr:SPOR domain-containing protein [Chloroflexota bacterium]
MSDDGFHEIQLNGKQLIFLFMAATVVSVVIFLCGVMVGRGVRSGRGDSPIQTSQLDAPAQAASPAAAPVTVPPAPAPSASPKAGASQPTPPESAEDSSVYKDLTSDHPKDTSLAAAAKTTAKPAAAPAAKTPAVVEKPTPKPTPPAPAEAGPPAAVTSGGYAVQLTALRDRSEADAVVKRLAAKGYPAFIVNPLPGKPPVYRVQVGRYQNRAEADRIASKLQKEEQFSPWVTH